MTVAEETVMDTELYVPCGMDCKTSGATVPRRCANSMVTATNTFTGEFQAGITDTLVPDVLVKLMSLMVTAHSRTESEGVSPIFTSTAVDEAGGVTGGVPVPVPEPLPHPRLPTVANARASDVHPAQIPVIERSMVLLHFHI